MTKSASLWRTCASLVPLLIITPWITTKLHYELPTPVVDLINPKTGLPQLSESRILSHVRVLSEDIGFRTVGTKEHALGEAWLLDQVNDLREQCKEAVSRTPGRKLECEVWRQQGSGTHRFDMMNKRVYKNYVDLTNIIVRVSDGTPEGKKNAVLVNSHLDSTLPSPGAADDAVSVGVMLECIRVLTQTPDWQPAHSIIFLFNNAEESLQDGSHLYATQHLTANTVRAVINLEAAGSTGPELLFQATSEEMIEAYSHVPRPFGTVLANDVFSSGIIMSDTDFRQFQEYQNLTGLDMAIVGNSYLYHTRRDVVENIEPGAAQHMAENTLALLTHLSSSGSPLPTLQNYSPPKTAYFSLLSRYFFSYHFSTAQQLYMATFLLSLPLFRFSRLHAQSVVGVPISLVFGLISANITAAVMSFMGQGMKWFSNERFCLVLYTPPALLGILVFQVFLNSRASGQNLERLSYRSVHLFFSAGAWAVQGLGIGSAGLLWFVSLFTGAGIVTDWVWGDTEVPIASYVLGTVGPLVLGTEVTASLTDIFVPLTGRMGSLPPVDNIIASLTTVAAFYAFPMILPLSHRFGTRALKTLTLLVAAWSILVCVIFSLPQITPFDKTHQKRFFGMHVENITSGDYTLQLGVADAAPGFEKLVNDVASEFGAPGAKPTLNVMDDWNPDWDVLYPFSQFVTSYKVSAPRPEGYESSWQKIFTVKAYDDMLDFATGTRKLTLKISHPGLIWTVIAFDAWVVDWSLDSPPPHGVARHHIKEASFYGTNEWSIRLEIKVPGLGAGKLTHEPLKINFVGIEEKAMWPGKKNDRAGPAMDVFERMDRWFEEERGGTEDVMLLGCVAGMAVI
ncbi:putative zinc metalloprotease C1259,02c OS=Schizosaccharomyces pombe (strain 972 / ATCC 24843) GN=SPCC1259.02c PE=3 SV=1 [Rhizoctonia solani AG-1 IB]|uniref:Peptide hydrolase n=1 Tax=Thanatephorus cucumeris (strain AG1-IB / isolate 7/3/14) TaxID=1108050 RepID=A0A0B7FAB8_THACB|nr:putative zinc metalloprotease C1259,02c OS=Schizosaccharomyces pombe (strain 972 / ATCC 24843) GN=SPCC1259.02c PE=3 SV=1 [Rhizoctonia solani AG-1 IB]